MEKDFNKIIQEAKNFSLSSGEKKKMMEKISAFVKENPMDSTPSPYFFHFFYMKKKLVSVLAVVLLVVISGGTSFAAKFSLPGDVLYPIKIHVNENLKYLAAFDDNAVAVTETQRATTRLQEAETLSMKGEVSTEAKAELKANFVENVKHVKKIAKEAEDRGDTATAEKINSDFQAVLEAHSAALDAIGVTKEDTEEVEDTKTDPKNVDTKINTEINVTDEPTKKLDTNEDDKKAEKSGKADIKIDAKIDASIKLNSSINSIKDSLKLKGL